MRSNSSVFPTCLALAFIYLSCHPVAWAGEAFVAGNSIPGVAETGNSGIPERVAGITLQSGENHLGTAVIDAGAGYAYFGAYTNPSRIVKVSLGNQNDPPSRVGALRLQSGESMVHGGVVDPAHGYAYFGTETSPGRIVKVALGKGDALPMRVGALVLNEGENYLACAAIDAAAGYAYFGTITSPGRVIKISLGEGDNPPTRVGAVVLNEGENTLLCAANDPVGGHLYFGTGHYNNAGQVIKIAPGVGDAIPVRIGSVTLQPSEPALLSMALDPLSGYTLMGSGTFPGKVTKVLLGEGDSTPQRTSGITVQDVNSFNVAVFDPTSRNGIFGSYDGSVAKVSMGEGSSIPSVVGTIPLEASEDLLYSAVIDSAKGYVYFGTGSFPGKVVKVSVGDDKYERGVIKATRITLPDEAIVADIHFFSHSADGNLLLAIYDDAEPKNLVWQSNNIANEAQEAVVSFPISSGAPEVLYLHAGTYWLAWQSNSSKPVGSHTMGTANEGFVFEHAFGGPPPTLGGSQLVQTNDRWTQYITYLKDPLIPCILGAQEVEAGMDRNVDGAVDASDLVD